MCTAISLKTKDHYFGRNLDMEYSYDESIVITPRNYSFKFRKSEEINSHYAMIGIAYEKDNYPLYYDATNEKGLSMAGLNFPYNAHYNNEVVGRENIAPFEFIPYILSLCGNVAEAKELLKRVNLVSVNFSDELPLSPLHWIISDKDNSITVESVLEGLKVYDNPVGVLTNNPTFEIQLSKLNNYLHLSPNDYVNNFTDNPKFYSRGMGAVGLPGDYSSQSRFVKTVFVKTNSMSEDDEKHSVSQFFHILASVEMPRGAVRIGDKYDITVYSSCCNTDKGIYYYKTYDNSMINGVDMNKENLDDDKLISYRLIKEMKISIQN